MAEKKAPAKKTTRKPAAPKVAPESVHEEGYWWIVSGTKRVNAGRNERYARGLLEDGTLL